MDLDANCQSKTNKETLSTKLPYKIYDDYFGNTVSSGTACENEKIELTFYYPERCISDIKVMNLLTFSPISESEKQKYSFRSKTLDDSTVSISFKMPPYPIFIKSDYTEKDTLTLSVDESSIDDYIFSRPKRYSSFSGKETRYTFQSPLTFERGENLSAEILLKENLNLKMLIDDGETNRSLDPTDSSECFEDNDSRYFKYYFSNISLNKPLKISFDIV